LGAALTTHAALDVSLSGIVPKERLVLYNYGCPRVGNFKFSEAVVNNVGTINRVVHYMDLVPHLPPCIFNAKKECVKGDFTDIPGSEIWHSWHTWENIYYL